MAKAKTKVAKSGRAWLNSDKGKRAHVFWSVDRMSAEFSVADCNRTATLDFSAAVEGLRFTTRKQKREAWRKLAKLEAELAKFRAALEHQAERSDE